MTYPTAHDLADSRQPRLAAPLPPRQRATAVHLVTVRSWDDLPWVSQPRVHQTVRLAWAQSEGWLVGNYLLMPARLHFFCAPRRNAPTLERWMWDWKRRFARLAAERVWEWEETHQQCRLDSWPAYECLWRSLRQTPVANGWVCEPNRWPHQGAVHHLGWP